jgi:hypothetical protein
MKTEFLFSEKTKQNKNKRKTTQTKTKLKKKKIEGNSKQKRPLAARVSSVTVTRIFSVRTWPLASTFWKYSRIQSFRKRTFLKTRFFFYILRLIVPISKLLRRSAMSRINCWSVSRALLCKSLIFFKTKSGYN